MTAEYPSRPRHDSLVLRDAVVWTPVLCQYHMMAMRNTRYSTSQRFIERFDLDLVTLGSNLPPWYRNHLAMLVSNTLHSVRLFRRGLWRGLLLVLLMCDYLVTLSSARSFGTSREALPWSNS